MTGLETIREEKARQHATHNADCTCKGNHFNDDKYKSHLAGFDAAIQIMNDREATGAGKFLTQACTIQGLQDEVDKLRAILNEFNMDALRMREQREEKLVNEVNSLKKALDLILPYVEASTDLPKGVLAVLLSPTESLRRQIAEIEKKDDAIFFARSVMAQITNKPTTGHFVLTSNESLVHAALADGTIGLGVNNEITSKG